MPSFHHLLRAVCVFGTVCVLFLQGLSARSVNTGGRPHPDSEGNCLRMEFRFEIQHLK